MSSNVILSICIPTYNRCDSLKKNLSLLLMQLETLDKETKKRVEVIVGNNRSPDDTDQAMYDLIKAVDFTPIRYFQNIKNVGPLHNIAFLGNTARGEHIWVLSDDDPLLPGALAFILEKLKEGFDALLLNWIESNCPQQKGLYPPKDIYIGRELIKQFGFRATLISCAVWRKKWFLAYYQETLETGFSQICVLFKGVAKKARTFVSETPYFIHNNDGASDFGGNSSDYLLRGGGLICQNLSKNGFHRRDLRLLIKQLLTTYVDLCSETASPNSKIKYPNIPKAIRYYRWKTKPYLIPMVKLLYKSVKREIALKFRDLPKKA